LTSADSNQPDGPSTGPQVEPPLDPLMRLHLAAAAPSLDAHALN
jgi:hypothetical protein